MEKLGHMEYANHPIMWIAALVGISIVLIQSALIIIKSLKAAKEMGMDSHRIKKGIRTSAIASIGPALGVVGSLLALLITMGSPISAFRLSVVGGSNFEAMAANFGAQALGSELSTNMTPLVFTNALWAMALGSVGWIIFVFLFAHKMEKINGLLTSGRKALLPAVGLGAMLGSFAYFNVGNYLKVKTNPEVTISAVESSGYQTGTDEGNIMGTIGIGVSIWVGILFLILAVLAGQALLSRLPKSIMMVLNLIIPALFGGVFAQFAIKSPITGIFALVISFVMTKVVALIPGNPSFIVTLVSVFTTIAFAKKIMDKKK